MGRIIQIMDKVLMNKKLNNIKELIQKNIEVLTDPSDYDFLKAINEVIIAYSDSKYME